MAHSSPVANLESDPDHFGNPHEYRSAGFCIIAHSGVGLTPIRGRAAGTSASTCLAQLLKQRCGGALTRNLKEIALQP